MSCTYSGSLGSFTLVDRSKVGKPRNYTEQIIFTKELHKEILFSLKDEMLNKEWDLKEERHQKEIEKLFKNIGGVCPDVDNLVSHFGGGNY